MPKKTKDMPEQYDVEVYDNGSLVTGFNGSQALCLAIDYTKNNTPVDEFGIWLRSADVYWGGPRPGKPPGA